MRQNATPMLSLYNVSGNVLPLACYNFDMNEPILITFGRNFTEKERNQK